MAFLKRVIFYSLLLILLVGCSKKTEQVELTVSAAASLKESMETIAELYEKENPHINIQFNFGGSGALAQQIRQGAPVDIFFSADQAQFTLLEKDDLIQTSTNLLGNELVLILSKDKNISVKQFQDLVDDSIQKIAIGTVETVPAGKYAKEVLENLRMWHSLEPKIVYTKDVREILSYVETGNAEVGVVYRTDALTSDNVQIITHAEESLHSPIIYTVGVIKQTKQKQEAELFYEYLKQENIKQVFIDNGFTIR